MKLSSHSDSHLIGCTGWITTAPKSIVISSGFDGNGAPALANSIKFLHSSYFEMGLQKTAKMICIIVETYFIPKAKIFNGNPPELGALDGKSIKSSEVEFSPLTMVT